MAERCCDWLESREVAFHPIKRGGVPLLAPSLVPFLVIFHSLNSPDYSYKNGFLYLSTLSAIFPLSLSLSTNSQLPD